MEATELIREHARHMSQMLAGVQQVVQASGPVPSVRRSAASVRRIAEHATAICGLSDREVVIYDRLPDTLSNVDVEKLTRVLVNLIDNAQRHNSPPALIEIHLAQVENDLEITVSDRGPGMPGSVAVRAFDRAASFGENPGSSGLGLWIVKELTAALAGSVQAEPRPGGGLVMRVRLPVPQAQQGLRTALVASCASNAS
jgi:signal transduction histidine kinase